jgi:hypothetical protein
MVSDQTIRNYLRADAALCFACGLPGLVVPGWLAGFLLPGQPSLLGFPMPTVMLELGIALALYAGLLLAMSFRPASPRGFVGFTVLADGAWVAGTFILLIAFGAAFSLWGSVALLVVAADTALIGALKWRALRGAPRAAVA